MCVAIRGSLHLERLIEYFEPIQKEIVFDLFFSDLGGVRPRELQFLHKGNVEISIETDSLFGNGAPKDAVLDCVSRNAELIHVEAGGLSYVLDSDKIKLGPAPRNGVEDLRPEFVRPTGNFHPVVRTADTAAAVKGDHLPFTLWELSAIPEGNFAIRMRLKMTGSTAEYLTGVKKGEAPPSFWIDGDAILVRDAKSNLNDPKLQNGNVVRGALEPLLASFAHMSPIIPRVFEFVEIRVDAPEERYNYRSFSTNTFPQTLSRDLSLNERQNLNWLVMTPDYSGAAPYDRFQVYFSQPGVPALV